jgi:hypothetical protein
MRFQPDKLAFGRHETFPLRFAWLSKGFQALLRDPRVFEADEATVELGVGKNMVRSIRYWLLATRMAELDGLDMKATPLGQRVFAETGWDPYLEDEATIWLLHWLLSSHPTQATVNFWFFNHYHKTNFSGAEAQAAFADYCKDKARVRYSVTTAKKDVPILLRMYVQSRGGGRIPAEEFLDSPLSLLKLVTYFSPTRGYVSRPERRDGLPIEVLGFAVAELFRARGLASIPMEQLMYARDGWPAPGLIFRLTESAMLAKLERLVQQFPKILELREIAGVYSVFLLKEVEPESMLQAYFDSHSAREAA